MLANKLESGAKFFRRYFVRTYLLPVLFVVSIFVVSPLTSHATFLTVSSNAGGSTLTFLGFPAFTDVGLFPASTLGTNTAGGGTYRGITTDGTNWYVAYAYGSTTYYYSYSSYANLINWTGGTSLGTTGGDTIRGIAFDSSTNNWYSITYAGANNTANTYSSFANLVANNPSASPQRASSGGDIFRGITRNSDTGSWHALLTSDPSDTYLLTYQTFSSLVSNTYVSISHYSASGISSANSVSAGNFSSAGLSGNNNWSLDTNQYALAYQSDGSTGTPINIYLVLGQSNAVGYGTIYGDSGNMPSSSDDAYIPFMFKVGHESESTGWWITSAGLTYLRQQTSWSTDGMMVSNNWLWETAWPAMTSWTNPATNVTYNPNGFYGPEMMAARTLYDAGKTNIGVIKYAFGGSELNGQWNPMWNNWGATAGYPEDYAMFISFMGKALNQYRSANYNPTIAGVFWMQGETDGEQAQYTVPYTSPAITQAYAYQTNMTNLIQAIRVTFGQPSLPFVLGEPQSNAVCVSGCVSGQTVQWPYASVVDSADAAVAAADSSNVIAISTNSIPGDQVGYEDSYHFSTAGEVTLGTMMGQAMLTLRP